MIMMHLQQLCIRKIFEAGIPSDDLPQLLQKEINYFQQYPIFNHIDNMKVRQFYEIIKYVYSEDVDDVIEVSLTPEEACVWTRDLMAVDLHNYTYIQQLDTLRLIDIVHVLQYRLDYADYTFLEYIINEILKRPLKSLHKSNEEILKYSFLK